MTRNAKVIFGGLFVGLALLAGVDLAQAAAKKVTICHRSPDVGGSQTISVAEPALAAHLKHGDQPGPCASGCESNPSSCDDGNACTSDVCLASGQCEHTAVNCDDGNQCTVDSCNSTLGCLNAPAPAGTSCDDGKACTGNDACNGTAACVGSPIAGCCTTNDECNDDDNCTADSCNGNTCSNQPVNCSVSDKCFVGFCNPATGGCDSTPVSCDDSNVCTDDNCDPVFGCSHTPTQNPPEPTEVSCQDGADNDCDGLTDGDDAADCACFTDPPNPPEPGRELTCADGIDNDCDGVTDDSDPDCAAQTICTTPGYLDLLQTPGDGRVSFCHSEDGSLFDFINTSTEECEPHNTLHEFDRFPTTGCDS